MRHRILAPRLLGCLLFVVWFGTPAALAQNEDELYPLARGNTWVYRVTTTVLRDQLRCEATGRATVAIVESITARRATIARAQIDQVTTSVRGLDAYPTDECRGRFSDGSTLDWEYVMVEGKLFEGAQFNTNLTHRAQTEGDQPFKEREIAPTLVFPLRVDAF